MMYNGTVYYKSIEFALMKLELSKELKSYKEFDLISQLLRSGTLIGANVNEAGDTVSKKDFVNKMFTTLKEVIESWHRLRLLKESKTIEINVEQNKYSKFK